LAAVRVPKTENIFNFKMPLPSFSESGQVILLRHWDWISTST